MAVASSGQLGISRPTTDLIGGWSINMAHLEAELADYKSLGITTVRVDFYWDWVQKAQNGAFDWSVFDTLTNKASEYGIELVGILQSYSNWDKNASLSTAEDIADYAKFSAAAAAHFKGRIDTWEIINEVNMGVMSPENYAKVLQASYAAIKNVNQDTLVLSSGLAPAPSNTGNVIGAVEFLQRMYANGAKGSFDAVGFHPYTYPLLPDNDAPWNGWQIMETGIRGVMLANGDGGKQVWVTELGAPTTGGANPVSQETQALILQQAVAFNKSYDWLGGPIMWYSYKDRGLDTSDGESWFGLVGPNGEKKAAYYMFQSLGLVQIPDVTPVPGDNVIFGNDQNNTINATNGKDTVHAGKGNDIIMANDGADTLFGEDGDDTIRAGNGNDIVYGGSGNDTLFGDDDNDTVNGNDGNDVLRGGVGNDVLMGEDGDDTLHGEDQDDKIYGDDGTDTLYGGNGNDLLEGESGNDKLYGGEGNDILGGSVGNDTLYGENGDDGLYGGDGDDLLDGGAGNDLLIGNAGNDKIYGGDGKDEIVGDDGDDQLYGGEGDDTLSGGNGKDTLSGDNGNDTLYGHTDNDILYGGAGNDRLHGGDAHDLLYGNDGNDFLNGNAGDDKLYGAEGNDELIGEDGNDLLYGNTGNDILSGGNGNDVLYGGAGSDTLSGGAGTDRFVFDATSFSASADFILDFQKGDIIDLSILDAKSTRGGNQSFNFIGKNWLSNSGDLGFYQDVANNVTHIQGDRNGDKVYDFDIVVKGVIEFNSSDFVL